MVQDIMKSGTSVTADTSMFGTRLNELENKVSKMEQKFTDLQAITDVVIEDISPTDGNRTDIKIEKIDVVSTEIVATDEKTSPLHIKQEPSEEASKTTADKLVARRALVGNKSK